MEEILELQKKLAEIQTSSNLNKLSDRIIVDLIDRILKTTENFQLIFTKDGSEYLTPQHLDQQVYELVQINKRINIIELPHLLNVGIEKIEPRLDIICSNKSDLYRLDDCLFTSQYLDSICEEINEDLQQKMQIPLIDLSSKFSLPIDYIRNLVQNKIGIIIQGKLVAGGQQLTTMSFMQIMSSKLKGILRASIRPISLNMIVKDYLIDEGNLNNLIEELSKNEEIDGKIQGGMFVPNRFLKNQELIVKKFFQQNDYIEYDLMAKQLLINKPKDFLKSMFKESCLFLDSCCFNKDSLDKIREQILSILDCGWVDLQNILPSILTNSDMDTIIFKYLGLNDTVEMDETIIFRKDFLEKSAQIFTNKITEYIYKTPQKLVEAKKDQKNIQKKNKKNQNNDEENKESSSEKIFAKEEVIKYLIEQKIIEHSDQDNYFEDKLYKLLIPKIAQLYEQIKKDLFESKKVGSVEIIQELQKKIEDLITALQYSLKSIKSLESNYSTIPTVLFHEALLTTSRYLLETLIIYLCKKIGINLPQNLFNNNNEKNNKNENDQFENVILSSLENNSNIFKTWEFILNAIENLPKDYSKILKESKELINKRKPDEFVDHFLKNSENFGLKSNLLLDKKIEKNFIHLQKYFAKEGIKKNKHDVKYCYFNCLVLLLIEENYFFISNSDEKFIFILNKIAEEINEGEKKDIVKEGMNILELVIKNEGNNNEEYFGSLKILEEIFQKLFKIVKL